jgi:hypothetical protein
MSAPLSSVKKVETQAGDLHLEARSEIEDHLRIVTVKVSAGMISSLASALTAAGVSFGTAQVYDVEALKLAAALRFEVEQVTDKGQEDAWVRTL